MGKEGFPEGTMLVSEKLPDPFQVGDSMGPLNMRQDSGRRGAGMSEVLWVVWECCSRIDAS